MPIYAPLPSELTKDINYKKITGLHACKISTTTVIINSPQTCLHLVLLVGLVQLCDPESNASGSLTTSKATHAGKVKG
jgi:hypothetical protein